MLIRPRPGLMNDRVNRLRPTSQVDPPLRFSTSAFYRELTR